MESKKMLSGIMVLCMFTTSIYYFAYYAGVNGLFSNQHDLCFIVKDMQDTNWTRFVLTVIVFLFSSILFVPSIFEVVLKISKLDDNDNFIPNLIIAFFVGIFSLFSTYKYGAMSNETECIVKYGSEFESLVEEDNGILSLVAYRQIAPSGTEIDRVMKKVDEQLNEKFDKYKYLRGEYKNNVLQEYADDYFRNGLVLDVDYEFKNYMANLINESYENQDKDKRLSKNFVIDENEGYRYKANIEQAKTETRKIEDNERFIGREAERIKHRF